MKKNRKKIFLFTNFWTKNDTQKTRENFTTIIITSLPQQKGDDDDDEKAFDDDDDDDATKKNGGSRERRRGRSSAIHERRSDGSESVRLRCLLFVFGFFLPIIERDCVL